jgi:hypothetical protein
MLAAICHKTSPSSSSLEPIYPHRVNHLLAFVPICNFMLLDNIVYPADCLKTEGDGKQMMMMMMDNFLSQSRWRFRWKHFQRRNQVGSRVASLLAPTEKTSIKRSETWPHLGFCWPPWPKFLATLLEILESSDVLIKSKLLCWSCSDWGLNAAG